MPRVALASGAAEAEARRACRRSTAFDVFLGYYDQVHAHSYYPPYIVRNSEEVPLANNRGGSDGETY